MARIEGAVDDRIATFLAPPTEVFESRLSRLLRGNDASGVDEPSRARSSHAAMREYLQLMYVLELKTDTIDGALKKNLMNLYAETYRQRSANFINLLKRAASPFFDSETRVAPSLVLSKDDLEYVRKLAANYACDHLRLLETLLCRMLDVQPLSEIESLLTPQTVPDEVVGSLSSEIAPQARAYATRWRAIRELANDGAPTPWPQRDDPIEEMLESLRL